MAAKLAHKLMAKFFKSGAGSALVGIGMSVNALHLVRMVPATEGEKSRLLHATRVEARDDESRHQALASWTQQQGLAGCAAVLTLEPGAYGMFQVERPNVPAEELSAAVRWRIKDFISYPPEQAVVDVFEVPAGRQGPATTLFAVAARRDLLAERIALIEGAGLELRRIDIAELALRNLAQQAAASGEALTVMHLQAHSGMFAICREGVFYIARSIDTGWETLRNARENSVFGPSLAEVCERIVLEVQRTMDYYDSYFAQAQVKSLVIFAEDDVAQELAAHAQTALGVTSRVVAVGELVTSDLEKSVLDGVSPLALGGVLGPL